MSLVNCIRKSSEFHLSLEPFPVFFRRQRALLLVSGAIFCCLYLCLIFSIPTAYFYAKMYNDPLNYYLKALNFFTNRTTAARFAENITPFHYVGMPGYLRLPLFYLANDFDTRLRLIQVTNVLLLAPVGMMFSYLLSTAIPRKWEKTACIMPFGFLFLSSYWQWNTFTPMSDIIFTFLTLLTIVLILSIKEFSAGRKHLALKLCAIAALTTLSFAVKYTGVLLLGFAFFAWFSLWRFRIGRIWTATIMVVTGLATGAVFYVNSSTIMHFMGKWEERVATTHFHDWILNLTAVSLPTMIIPNFNHFYSLRLTNASRPYFGFHWATSALDVGISAIGVSLTGFIFLGIWRSRHKFLPEAVYLVAALPVITPITTSTTRYLLPYQVFIWIFFLGGIRPIVEFFQKVSSKFRIYQRGLIFVGVLICTTLVSVRIMNLARSRNVETSQLLSSVKDISSVYGDLKRFLARLPLDRSVLIHTGDLYWGDRNKWQAILELRYYAPDRSLPELAARYDTYVVFDRELRLDPNFGSEESAVLSSLGHYGSFTFEKVFSEKNRFAWATVYRIVPADRRPDKLDTDSSKL